MGRFERFVLFGKKIADDLFHAIQPRDAVFGKRVFVKDHVQPCRVEFAALNLSDVVVNSFGVEYLSLLQTMIGEQIFFHSALSFEEFRKLFVLLLLIVR